MELDLSQPAAQLTAQLVDIESVSGNEQPLANAIAAALAQLPHLVLHRDGNAIVARTQFGHAERIVLAGHIDTVPVHSNLPSHVDGGLLYGCGSCDMKSGVAVQLRLATRLTAASRDVTFVFYDCEEVEAERNGLLRLSRNSPHLLGSDFAVLLEPTGSVVEGGCQGTLRADVIARGRRAHSARSWLGSNAIHAAGGILDVLRGYVPREPVVDGLRYHEGLNAVGISGGVAGNVIPDECVVSVNFRFAPDRSPDEAAGHVLEVFDGWEVVITDTAGGARPGLDEPAAASFLAAVRDDAAVGDAAEGEPRAKLGWTDVARFAALGIPAVNFGPGDPQLAHTKDEHVPIAQIKQCERQLLTWLAPAH